ncbi:HD-GYP domain-containing protein [Moorella sulfitireducens]|uniref:HD-GYP domain-containing protein n=1 Tax=Neomoorella sulfitireducens TaxID=2972948 RepID=UPI0021ACBFDA|nr:HD-GYP domain-containing protein [Moorella sulfitireducens]
MRKLSVDSLKPGMVVARAIYSAEGQVLLNKGVVLKPGFIIRLKEMGVPAVYIRDNLLGELEVEDTVSEQTRLAAVKTVRELFGNYQDHAKGHVPLLVDSALIKKVVISLLEDLLDRKELMVNLTDIRALDDYTFAHSVNVCILALVTGLTLRYSREALLHLGIGALLHDIGKTCIPLYILNKPGKLTMEEYELVCRHAQYGFDILRIQKEVSMVSARVALEHHERYNGSGYPQGLKGKEIHEFAMITGVADVYDALTADRVYRRAYPPHEAYEMLSGSGNFTLDFEIVKAFLANVAAYPVGTLVQLNSGDVGVVTGTARGHSHRPRVRLLYRPSGEPYGDQVTIDLVAKMEYYVSRVLPEEYLPTHPPGQPRIAEGDREGYRVL